MFLYHWTEWEEHLCWYSTQLTITRHNRKKTTPPLPLPEVTVVPLVCCVPNRRLLEQKSRIQQCCEKRFMTGSVPSVDATLLCRNWGWRAGAQVPNSALHRRRLRGANAKTVRRLVGRKEAGARPGWGGGGLPILCPAARPSYLFPLFSGRRYE